MITTHHDGHGLNEQILILPDEPGPGGASHSYEFRYLLPDGLESRVGLLQFQKGPRNVKGSTPGLTANAVLAAVVHHLRGFQEGDYRNRQTACAITHIEEAIHWIKDRADERAKRGVLGTYEK